MTGAQRPRRRRRQERTGSQRRRHRRRQEGENSATLVESTGGVRVAMHDLGGSGPVVLLGHATGFCGPTWGPVATRLPGRHAWAPDLRGHGDSVIPDGLTLDWAGFGDDVLAAVDHLAPAGPIVAAGHSKGGAALLLAEQARPGTFAALYLYEPVVFPAHLALPSEESPLAQGARRRREHFPDRASARDNFSSKPPLDALHPDALAAYVDHGFTDDPERGGVTLKCRPEIEAATYEMGPRHQAWDHLVAVTCPVTVARGVPDSGGPAQVARQIAERLPRGRLVEHPELGHFGPLQDPDRIADDIQTALW